MYLFCGALCLSNANVIVLSFFSTLCYKFNKKTFYFDRVIPFKIDIGQMLWLISISVITLFIFCSSQNRYCEHLAKQIRYIGLLCTALAEGRADFTKLVH